VIPDVEKTVSDYLRDDDDVAAIVDERVVGSTPKKTEDPWVRVTLLDAPQDPRSSNDHLVAAYLQLDCYAGRTGLNGSQQAQAALLGRTVRAALMKIGDAEHDGAVVSEARINGDARVPDEALEDARERRVLTTTVYLHAVPA
jgi:hypothetical protein